MTTTQTQCKAQVAAGSYTYAARNSARQCANTATVGGYCHAHRRYAEVTPIDRDAFTALAAGLKK